MRDKGRNVNYITENNYVYVEPGIVSKNEVYKRFFSLTFQNPVQPPLPVISTINRIGQPECLFLCFIKQR
jgi:hypothetical protein